VSDDDEDKVVAALRKLMGGDAHTTPMTSATHLRDDLGLDSGALIELTVLVHSMYGVDLGRRSAERKILPTTVGDLTLLMKKS
jgi:acyl carrier protein